MAVFVVTSLADSAGFGDLTLREAVAQANADPDQDRIVFDAALSGGTITLALGALELAHDLSISGDIDGDGAADIRVDGGGLSRVFDITGSSVEIQSLTISGGDAAGSSHDADGGGISVASGASLTLRNSTLTENVARLGGGLSNNGTVTVISSTISGNTAEIGGGFFNAGSVAGSADLINVTLSGNSAEETGGGVFNNFGAAPLQILHSTISGNTAGLTGSGIFVSSEAISVQNSLIIGNPGGPDADVNGAITNLGGALVGGSAADVFAALDGSGGGRLSDNGGPVQTIALKADARNPALDAAVPGQGPETDARGNARVDQSGVPLPSSRDLTIADIGAYELALSGPAFTGRDRYWRPENTTFAVDLSASDDLSSEGNGLTYSLSGGPDQTLFALNAATGQMWLRNAPDFEAPGDADSNNRYEVHVTVTDAAGFSDAMTLEIIVTNVWESGESLTLVGTEAADVLRGRNGNDVLFGRGGNDVMTGWIGEDRLTGGAGDDAMAGGPGNDVLFGNLGADRLFGGAGNDQMFGSDGADLMEGGDGWDRMFGGGQADQMFGNDGTDEMFGADGWDRMFGGAQSDLMQGGNGNDQMYGGNGADRMFGGGQSDTMFGDGGADQMYGGFGFDRMFGGAQSDRMFGEAGNDLLVGGFGQDRMSGGAGADTFFFDDGHTGNGPVWRDIITDFQPGIDILNLRQIDAYRWRAGDQNFDFAGASAAANSVWYAVTGANTIVSGDVNGDRIADFQIMLLDVTGIGASDIVL